MGTVCAVAAAALVCAGASGTQVDLPAPETSGEGLLIAVAPGATILELDALLAAAGASLERAVWEIRVLAVRVPTERLDLALQLLEQHPAVEHVEREAEVAALESPPDDPRWAGQWGLQRARFPAAWSTTRGSADTVVAIVDTGVERTHPDLRTALLPGYDVVSGDRDPSDANGHGTAVAGVLAARTDNGTGIAGACWSCRLLPVKVLDRNGRGTSADLAAGIIWAVDHGADVVNLSLGGDRSTIAEERAVAYAARKDVVLVAAAGNDGAQRRQFPAAIRHVIAVAATDHHDRLYSWSNRGDWVEVAAPGCNTSPWRGAAYATFCGTSSAAPLVAGLAALVRSAQPEANAAEVARIVKRAVTPGGRLDASLAFPRKPAVARARPTPLRRTVERLVRRAARR